MYQLLWADDSMANLLAHLAKEMSCPNNESILVEMHNHQVLAPINLDIVEWDVLKGDIFPIDGS